MAIAIPGGGMLTREDYLQVVRSTPLVSVDLIVRDVEDLVLLGLRLNRPAQGVWFTPGGVVRKDETLDIAFRRISDAELGMKLERADAALVGVYEHLYPDNFAAEPGFGTHYIVLAHEIRLASAPPVLPAEQHRAYRWVTLDELASDAMVHPYARGYAKALRPLG